MSGTVGDIAKGALVVMSGGLAGPAGALLAKDKGGKLIDSLAAPAPASLQNPNALSSTPTQADASAAADRKTLARESAIASSSTILTGGAGLLDTPTTTSRTLMGG